MKEKTFQIKKYLTNTQIRLDSTKEFHFKFLSKPNETNGVEVQDLKAVADKFGQPVYIIMEPKLLLVLEENYPRFKWVGKKFRLVREPRKNGRTAPNYKVAEIR